MIVVNPEAGLAGPTRARVASATLSVLVLGLGLACGEPSRTCGEGTELRDGVCAPIAEGRCGEGTILVDGICFAAPLDAGPSGCGPGTVLEGGVCVAVDGGTSCGEGTVLQDGRCVVVGADGGTCVPSCLGRVCGEDGCGGSCGSCEDPTLPLCEPATGQCGALCVPRCEGRGCGADGCGGSCGSCADAERCTSEGRCVPEAWTCEQAHFGDGAVCDCGCGAPDADCALGRPVSGCGEQERCDLGGACVPALPAAWTCAASTYDALDGCHCGCGAPDPDCALPGGLWGCPPGVTSCNGDGTCGSCAPSCGGKACGDDGCGGSCGPCDGAAGQVCHLGACVDPCSPAPIACERNGCGDDGCGGSCGGCGSDESCVDGQCVADPVVVPNDSCVGRCGSVTPAGCYCHANCVAAANCCPDYVAECACTPACTGKTCGSDGCGGSCGQCGGATPFCSDQGLCTSDCTPECGGRACGDDGCGGSCGSCLADESCHWNGACVPSAWTCSPGYYADELGCDCGCGAPDPDCSQPAALPFNCPASVSCGLDGLCAMSVCHSNPSCPTGQWCTGLYAEGDHDFGGFCAATTADADVPGTACTIGESCATRLCVAGQCRLHCATDADCAGTGVCGGLEVRDPSTSRLQGYVDACQLVGGSGQACASQGGCPQGERCTVHMDPATRQPRYLCAVVLGADAAQGRPCALDPCPDGMRCQLTAQGAVCALPCPGGAADCPAGLACTSVLFAPILDDGATVPLCLPE